MIKGMGRWVGGNLGLYCLLGLGPTPFYWASFYLFAVCTNTVGTPTGNRNRNGEARNILSPASPGGDRFWPIKVPTETKIIPSSSPNGWNLH